MEVFKISESNDGIIIASLIKEIYLKLNNNIGNEFKESGLTMPQLMLIRILSRNKKLKVSEISSIMNLTKGTVSGIIDRMERQGILIRKRDDEDRRIVYVELSNKGREITEGMRDTMNDYFSSLFSKCTSEQRDKIYEGLHILKGIVDNLDSQQIDY